MEQTEQGADATLSYRTHLADDGDNILLEENTDFGTDILTSEGINPPENILEKRKHIESKSHNIT